MTMPPRIASDVALLRRVPPVSFRYRHRPLYRICRWWQREQARADAMAAMQRHRSALKASTREGVSYRYAREFQDARLQGRRLGRGATWADAHQP